MSKCSRFFLGLDGSFARLPRGPKSTPAAPAKHIGDEALVSGDIDKAETDAGFFQEGETRSIVMPRRFSSRGGGMRAGQTSTSEDLPCRCGRRYDDYPLLSWSGMRRAELQFKR